MLHHLDVHVRNIGRAKALFGSLAAGLGYRERYADDEFVGYEPIGQPRPLIGFIFDPEHAAGSLRVAFAVASNELVNALGATAKAHGARAIEGPGPCPEYGDDYYAVFFEDDEGNRFEIVRAE